ncbi:RNA polymerase sigma-70 factor, ECF subfamily [Amycolatopsis xylanica]|uniref:RNA polymerase sigma factor n=2 Tax=Amycolatopsis TaxID=1813 RepID=A0A1H3N3L0_9PSEU|nr:sigma-70 family RNA polymerase sigma factor [Amycolatopsis xylanica]SDY83462.1 RNA polymerase sigma-70 factor, ECF subfamily [Amycolatopsis xylanica]
MPHLKMDSATLREVMDEHEAALRRYVRKLTGTDVQLAEDIVQETLLRAWQRPEALTTRHTSIRPWLYTVARNLVCDHWRARKARPLEVDDTGLDTVAVAKDEIASVELTHAMREAMDRLRPEHRAVLAQLYFRDLSIKDTARELGIPLGTVKSRTYNALRALRQAVEELGLTVSPNR